MTLRVHAALALAVALAGCARVSAPRAFGAGKTRVGTINADQLSRLYEEFWEEKLKLDPLLATYVGDPRYNDQLPDFGSAEYRQQSHAFAERWLERIEAIGTTGLTDQELLSYQIFVRDAKNSLEGEKYPGWMQPISQIFSFHTSAAQLGSGTGTQPFKTVKDYDDWLARGNRLPVLFDTSIANMRAGMQAEVVQPTALMVKVLPQLDAIIKDKPEETEFWGPIKNMPAGFSAADRERLTVAYRDMIGQQILPAYREIRAFIADEYMAKTRATAGMHALPNGEAWYAFNARQNTTTEMTPEEIHRIGLDEVARIHREIIKVMAQVGFQGSLQEFFKFMQDDPRFTFGSERVLLEHYRALEATINRKIPEQFSVTPKSPFEVRPIEPFRAKSFASAQYQRPSADGTRPGIFYVNTWDLPTRKIWEAENLYLHEAIPGHHFQIALQQELTGMPKFRRFGRSIAFPEGWGLYAESLGKDLGVYTDPYNYFGCLQGDLWRAIRLVVDTGVHSKGWTREQVIQYMLDNSAASETHSTAEAERYMAIPGQALAYKIGALKIHKLRARAERELGDKFDVREFHAEMLGDGSVPLDVLEGKIERWIIATVDGRRSSSPAGLSGNRVDAFARAEDLPEADMNQIAERYVKLVLQTGQHDPDLVDAYYGPEALRPADGKETPLEALLAVATALQTEASAVQLPSDTDELTRLRKLYLTRQLQAVHARLRMLMGETLAFDEESNLLYDAVAPANAEASFAGTLAELESLLPGSGALIDRYDAFRLQFVIPPDRLDRVFTLAIDECRARTAAQLTLPEGESFTVEYVTGKSWGAYNWYKGGFRSVIQVNTDLPITIDRAVDLACHEGYPGHHVYNVLLEKNLVRDRRWIEFSVYPLFSPQSLIAEGTANFGIAVAFSGESRIAFERAVLFPAAGLDAADAEKYYAVDSRIKRLSYTGNEAARRYLNGEISREQAVEWLQRYAMMPKERAEKRTRFFDQYRSYVINYNLGEDIVRAWVEKQADSPSERWKAFEGLLSSPRLPSGLR